MSFPRYPKYKASGVDWLGDVPEHWDVLRLRTVADINPSKSEIGMLSRDTPVSFLPMEAIGDDGGLILDRERPIGEVEKGYTYFRDDDVTVAKITPCFENGKGALMRSLTNGIGFGTTELIVVRPQRQRLSSKFLHSVFRSSEFLKMGEASMYGAGGQKRVPDEFVRNFRTAIPPHQEQSAIAAFLDRETGKIDALVAEQQRLIALLQEKRQAVISHAVTKGLNPDAKMKPSGIEWLGNVPEHWEVMAYRHLVSRVIVGIAEAATHAYADEGVPIVRSTNIKSGDIDQSQLLYIKNEFAEKLDSKALHAGDIVTTRTGANVGVSAVVPESLHMSQCFTLVVSSPKPEIANSLFYNYFINSTAGKIYIDLTAWGSGQPNISVPIIQEMHTVVPPLYEQEVIVTHIRSESTRYDSLITEAERAIELLQERRTALISAAVTGKIDVRGLVPTEAA